MFRIVLGFITTFAFINFAIASENLQRFDRVIAAYDFENDIAIGALDIGPRNIQAGFFRGAFKSDELKFGNKSLAFERSGHFSAREDSFLSVFSEASISFWIKTPEQPIDILVAMGAYNGFENEGITSIRVLRDNGGIRITQIGHGTRSAEGYNIEDVKVMDSKWHHLVFTLDHNKYTFFFDSKNVFNENAMYEAIISWNPITRENVPVYIGYVGDRTTISIELVPDYYKINGMILFDDLVFYEEAFSATDIQELYKNGLKNFLEVMPVDPQEKVATTWAEIKSRR